MFLDLKHEAVFRLVRKFLAYSVKRVFSVDFARTHPPLDPLLTQLIQVRTVRIMFWGSCTVWQRAVAADVSEELASSASSKQIQGQRTLLRTERDKNETEV
jgi:hypothetical protein